MKKLLLSVLTLGLGLGLLSQPMITEAGAVAITAEESNLSQVEVNVNGDFIPMDVHPIQEGNRLFVPIRTLASLGLSYAWNPNTRITTVKNKNGDYLKIEVNSSTAYKNEKPVKMDAPAKNKDGRVLVPIRFVSESLGYHVQYESIRKIVFIASSDFTFDVNLLQQGRSAGSTKSCNITTRDSEF